MSSLRQPNSIARRVVAEADHRRYQRVRIDVLGRFMLVDRTEYPCQVVDMSLGGLSLMSPVQGEIGEHIVAYLDHIGRVDGEIARLSEGGFAMTIHATARKRDKLAVELTWLANRHLLNKQEDRRHERMEPGQPFSNVVLPDGREVRAKIIDVSLSGAAIALDKPPPIGACIMIGKMRARVLHHIDSGVAVEFAVAQSPDSIQNNL